MTWPQNVGNRISKDLNFRGCPGSLYRRPPPTIEPPSVKSWICPREPLRGTKICFMGVA